MPRVPQEERPSRQTRRGPPGRVADVSDGDPDHCIRRDGRARRRGVGSPTAQHEWVIRPLIDAGLGVDRIRELLFRLGFEAIVSEGRGTAARLTTLVSAEPPHVQAAWHEVIGRMISLHRSGT